MDDPPAAGLAEAQEPASGASYRQGVRKRGQEARTREGATETGGPARARRAKGDAEVSARPRLVKAADVEEPDADRIFHLAVREAMLVFLRAYERRFLPGLKKTNRQATSNSGIG
jgi:hypothetical protein